jgi:MFS family permease
VPVRRKFVVVLQLVLAVVAAGILLGGVLSGRTSSPWDRKVSVVTGLLMVAIAAISVTRL